MADDLADVDEEQAFLARARGVRDVRGQEFDPPVRQDAAAKPAADPVSARVLGPGSAGRWRPGCWCRAERIARGTHMLSVHDGSCSRSAERYALGRMKWSW